VATATVIIPARLGSTRFPGKVLADRTGRPMIRHVVEAAARARGVARVVVAADDEAVSRAVRAFGGECVMTRRDHPNGTSRLAEAAAILGLPGDAVVVNVQGDEPEIEPAIIEAGLNALAGSAAPMATVASPFGPDEDPANPNIVKVVLRLDGTAMYFSRAAIPFVRDPGGGGIPPLRHVGLYVYRRGFLDAYTMLDSTELERTEQLEQLRVLAHGYPIAVAVEPTRGLSGIDTPEQYEAFVQRWRRAHP
jgi:3-deoxy-manno-octulosonate cytidylyltransferase (CMP-KDO synthetase)